MRRGLQAIVFASLLLATGCGDASDGDLIGTAPSPVASAAETGELRELTAAVCEPSSEPCEDTRMWDTNGSCTTNLGRDCVEADADDALRRWVHDPRGGPDGAGDAELLAVLDEHTVVIGYAFGANLTFAGAQVHEADPDTDRSPPHRDRRREPSDPVTPRAVTAALLSAMAACSLVGSEVPAEWKLAEAPDGRTLVVRVALEVPCTGPSPRAPTRP